MRHHGDGTRHPCLSSSTFANPVFDGAGEGGEDKHEEEGSNTTSGGGRRRRESGVGALVPVRLSDDYTNNGNGAVLQVQTYAEQYNLDSNSNGDSGNSRVRQLVYSIPVQAAVTLLIIFDAVLLAVDLSLNVQDKGSLQWVDAVTAAILILLIGEVALRYVADGHSRFCRDLWNFVDLAVLLASLALVFTGLEEEGRIAAVGYFGRTVRQLIRLSRVVRLFTRAKGAAEAQAVAARRIIGGNKKRFVDQSFDLDLVYITPNIIAMSCPCEGRREYYRNPLREVARFLQERHKQAFHVYNFCPELPYRHEPLGGRVTCFDVQDHTPPRLAQLCRFCSECFDFLIDNSNTGDAMLDVTRVAAVHCRGGKGRTGTAVAAYLLYSGQCSTANEALDLFARRRTDLTKSGKLQGVKNPSQRRYVRYFDQYLKQQRLALQARLSTRGDDAAPPTTPAGVPHPLPMPSARPIRLERLCGRDVLCPSYFPRADGLRLKVTVSCISDENESAFLGDAESDAGPVINATGSGFDINLGGFRVGGNVRVNLWNADEYRAVGKRRKKTMGIVRRFLDAGTPMETAGGDDGEEELCEAGKEPGILAFFWVHTAMMAGSGDTVVLTVGQLDKANKLKNKLIHPDGQIVLKLKYDEMV
ncbi:phosphatidylinositol 3,4,5-trisphosphate 3-phosphatase [Pycnococcus provasolii]